MITGEVLVLNKYWQPLYIVSMEDAICMIFNKRAKILLDDGGLLSLKDWIEFSKLILEDINGGYKKINTVNGPLIRPEIIIMHKNSYQPRYTVSFSRKLIEIRDQGICQYCGKILSKKDKTIDHVIPKSAGGKTIWENVVICCRKCNQKKGNKTPEEAGMKLLRNPEKPLLIKLITQEAKNERWLKFLQFANTM